MEPAAESPDAGSPEATEDLVLLYGVMAFKGVGTDIGIAIGIGIIGIDIGMDTDIATSTGMGIV